MKLPSDSIGVTDVRSFRECPRRFAFGMQRHTEAGEHPEATTTANAYGSAIHEAIAFAEEHEATDDQAIQAGFSKYASYLEPDDLQRMKDDMLTYRARDYTGVRTVAVEKEVRVPLFVHNGTQIYFRAKLDRVYQRLDNPSVFVHVDYKSSRHPMTDADVHSDVQMWAYNWLIHEFWPECSTLVQVYDQLRFGAVPTRKSAEQRSQIKGWLIAEITAILDTEDMEPKINDWCGWCPIAESCPAVKRASDWTAAKIQALDPIQDAPSLEPYVELMEEVGQARKLLERYENSVRDVLKMLPDARRAELGYELRERRSTFWPPEALRAAHELLGDDFYGLVKVTKTAVEQHPDAALLLPLAEEQQGAGFLRKRRTT